jgi:hypothetical protein
VLAGYNLSEVPEPTGEDYNKAVSVLLPYLLSHRTRLACLGDRISSSTAQEDAARAAGEDPAEQLATPADTDAIAELSLLTAEQRALLAEAVDTAILKVTRS